MRYISLSLSLMRKFAQSSRFTQMPVYSTSTLLFFASIPRRFVNTGDFMRSTPHVCRHSKQLRRHSRVRVPRRLHKVFPKGRQVNSPFSTREKHRRYKVAVLPPREREARRAAAPGAARSLVLSIVIPRSRAISRQNGSTSDKPTREIN